MTKFKDEKGDDAALHLVKFHMHVCKLKVQFHEDVHGNLKTKSMILV